MFGPLMINTWIAATAVAVIAGVTGFFAVLRGSTFAAHAIPNGAFAGAAGASLLGLNPFAGLAVFSLAGALGIAGLSRRARNDVATALTFVLMLGVGALFVSWSSGYAQEAYSLLFGEVFGVSAAEVRPILVLGAVSVAASSSRDSATSRNGTGSYVPVRTSRMSETVRLPSTRFNAS